MDKVKIYVYAKRYLEIEIATDKEIITRCGKDLVQSIKEDIERHENELSQINDLINRKKKA